MLIKKIVATGVFIVDLEGKILCLHRKTGFREGGKYGVPGGVVRKNRGIIGTAVYKLKNEVGVVGKKEDLVKTGKFEYKAEENNIVFHLFVYKIAKKHNQIEIEVNEEGHDGFIWEKPEVLMERKDMMVGMYVLLPAFISHF